MTDIADRLNIYAALDPVERAEVDAYVADHTEWQEQHAEAQALAALLEVAAADDAERIAQQAVDERLGLAPAAAGVGGGRSLEAELVASRLDELALSAEDPVEKFERLTGRSLDSAPATHSPRPLRAPDRAAAGPRRRRRLPQWVALAAVVLAVGYGGLFAASAASVSERTQVAALAELSSYEAPVLRGEDTSALAAQLDAVLDRVDAARQSWLGLFPSYNADALAAVAADLGATAAEAPASSSVSQEARFALGRVYLQQGRDADAARVLGTLVREESYRASEARRLLDYIRAQGGA